MTVDVVFLAQEIVVGPSSYPTEEIGDNARAFRQLGLGYANLGALLMCDGVPYDSDAGRNIAGAITALMTGRGYRKSAEIAAAVGPTTSTRRTASRTTTSCACTATPPMRSTAPASRASCSRPRSAAGTRRSSSATSTATATLRRRCSLRPERSAS